MDLITFLNDNMSTITGDVVKPTKSVFGEITEHEYIFDGGVLLVTDWAMDEFLEMAFLTEQRDDKLLVINMLEEYGDFKKLVDLLPDSSHMERDYFKVGYVGRNLLHVTPRQWTIQYISTHGEKDIRISESELTKIISDAVRKVRNITE